MAINSIVKTPDYFKKENIVYFYDAINIPCIFLWPAKHKTPKNLVKKMTKKLTFFTLSCCQNFIIEDKSMKYEYIVEENSVIADLKTNLKKMVPVLI